MQNKKFIFWGTPEVASQTLEILKKNGFLPVLIITSKDQPQGRKMLLTPPPVKIFAIENNIPYLQPDNLDEELFETFSKLDFELYKTIFHYKVCSYNIKNMSVRFKIPHKQKKTIFNINNFNF